MPVDDIPASWSKARGVAGRPVPLYGTLAARAIWGGYALDQMAPVRTLVASNWPLLRLCIESAIADDTDVDVVGKAGGWHDVMEQVRTLTPDVTVAACLSANQRETVLALRKIERRLACPVVVVGPSEPPAPVWWMLIAGISGYVTFDQAPSELSRSIKAAAYGSAIFSARVNPLATALHWGKRPVWASLSNRELDVARCVANGLTDGDAAADLGITESTVQKHLSRAMRKLDCGDRVEFVARLFAAGVLASDDMVVSGATAPSAA
jgi:DNA-binding NarL/FixJ family response regulator